MRARIAMVLIGGLTATTVWSQTAVPPPVAVLQPSAAVAVNAVQPPPASRLPQPAPATALDLDQRDPDLDGARISVVFEQPVPIREVLMLLVRGTRLSLVPVPGPALEQRLSADLKNVTIREALEAVLDPLGLDFTLRGRLLTVHPRELETQLFDIDYVATNPTDGAADFYTDVEGGVRALLSDGGRFHLDRAASLLEVTDSPGHLRRVETYVQTALRRAVRQIALDATVVEVDLSASPLARIDWQSVLRRLAPGVGDANPAAVSAITLPTGSIQPVLQALAEQGPARVVARPRLVATNNQPALIRSENEEGFSLTVTPQIGSAGIIHMAVHPRIVARATPDAVPGHAQPVAVREAATLLRVRHGETVALFGFTLWSGGADGRARKTDLVILLTPTIVAPGVSIADARR